MAARLTEEEVRFHGDAVDALVALEAIGGAILLEDSRLPRERRTAFIGFAPWAVLESGPEGVRTRFRNGSNEAPDEPFAALRDLARRRFGGDVPPLPDVERSGGLAGYLGYDLRTRVERLPDRNPKDSTLPDAWMGVFDCFLRLDGDGLQGRATLGSWDGDAGGNERLAAARQALAASRAAPQPSPEPSRRRPAVANFSKRRYLDRVERIREYIRSGDAYQVNLTQRFLVASEADPIAVYRRLRDAHGSRYGGFLRVASAAVLSASPECFLSVRGRRVETRPIKGTAPRSDDPSEDRSRAELLLRSEKDRAELAMIVDLMRNDLARVCRAGSIQVVDHAHLESAPTVHHLVTAVVGELDAAKDVFDLLRATWPAGSITGCPKIRAMEIIDELETLRRGPYTGAFGIVAPDLSAELDVAIRTMVLEGGFARIHGGGGIVIDSVGEAEWAESLAKVSGLLKATGGRVE